MPSHPGPAAVKQGAVPPALLGRSLVLFMDLWAVTSLTEKIHPSGFTFLQGETAAIKLPTN